MTQKVINFHWLFSVQEQTVQYEQLQKLVAVTCEGRRYQCEYRMQYARGYSLPPTSSETLKSGLKCSMGNGVQVSTS